MECGVPNCDLPEAVFITGDVSHLADNDWRSACAGVEVSIGVDMNYQPSSLKCIEVLVCFVHC